MHILSHPLYLAPIPLYIQLYSAEGIIIDGDSPFVKQTFRNRTLIATERGVQALTIPIEHNGSQAMRDVRISEHGNWRHLHWNALVSAYRKSPFFDYYADDLRPFYEQPIEFLADFNEGLQRTVLTALDLEPRFVRTNAYKATPDADTLDLRQVISHTHAADHDPRFKSVPYYQVFAHKHGFLPNLSILDLLFNMGPEARLVLRDSLSV